VNEKRAPRIVVAGGGTGGHLFPALAVADELRERRPGAAIRFIGGRRGIETRLVPARGYPLRTLPLSGLKGAGMMRRITASAAAGAGVIRCAAAYLRERPDLVIGAGGYASGPAVLAARLLGVRTMVLEQNHFPGATNRWLARWVDALCVPSEAARERLGGRAGSSPATQRREFATIGEAPAAPCSRFGLRRESRPARSTARWRRPAGAGDARPSSHASSTRRERTTRKSSPAPTPSATREGGDYAPSRFSTTCRDAWRRRTS
jgi:UDP-N-acetylglucosamine--N-acetylmuramyl-(pentapeptide) pyrophosphoryl-undecaprenol N-acetylglucosamine transferase